MREVTGGDLPARIWKEFVTQSAAARASRARRPATTATIATTGASLDPQAEPSAIIRGVPNIRRNGLQEIDGRVIRLSGIERIAGRAVRNFRRYVGDREAVCAPTGNGNEHRCRVGDQDLSRVVLYNGGARASADASPELKAAEQQARSEHAGIWADEDDDD